MADALIIREIGAGEFGLLWPIFHEVVAEGETYSYAPDMPFEQARQLWTSEGARCFVALLDGVCVGGYIRPNQRGGGSHVANCGYMTASSATGRGVGRAMCEHSIAHAKARGFRAMQFNFVVSTNERAVRWWQTCGFDIVGRLPGAFNHPTLGDVDALVMFRPLN
jgi:ribosomal protein S18 acetylase RimI-like enzyme